MPMKTRPKLNLLNRSYDTIFIATVIFLYKTGMSDTNLPKCPALIRLIKMKCCMILIDICNILAACIEGRAEFDVFKNHPTG